MFRRIKTKAVEVMDSIDREVVRAIVRRLLFVGLPFALISAFILTGLACDVGTALVGKALPESRGASVDSFGAVSLEETILMSDVIIAGRLKSVDRGVELRKISFRHFPDEPDLFTYAKTLEFTFEVEQYLKGSGPDEVVGIVFSHDQNYKTKLGASLGGTEPHPDRNDHWDIREAIIFLRDDAKDPRVDWKQGRYYLGNAIGNHVSYSINSDYKAWLPTNEGSDAFLLKSDRGTGPPKTITLPDLKMLIAKLDQEVAVKTDLYRECVLWGYTWEREVEYLRKVSPSKFYRQTTRIYIDSGIPQGSKLHIDEMAGMQLYVEAENPSPPGVSGDYILAGQDADLFTASWPGDIFAARPLPAGTYRTFHAYQYYATPCNAPVPEAELQRQELVVNVTAPEGTVHEAFFDPDATLAVTYSEGPVGRIAWADGSVTATATGQLAGHVLEFIALDGSTSLSLEVDKAGETDTALTWKLATQPWQDGDQLMLRIRG